LKKVDWFSIFVTTALLTFPVRTEAQQAGKAARIGYLGNSTASGTAELLDGFRKQMTQLNWIEGKNLTIEYRYAEGKGPSRLADLALELVGLKLDLIVADSPTAAMAAKKATGTIPIVMVGVSDPVAHGLIANLARPGGNITGLAGVGDELAGKRVEILNEVLPNSTRFGLIIGSGGLGGALQVKVMKKTASALGLKLVEVGSGSDQEKLVKAFQTAVRERVNAIIPTAGPVMFAQRKSVTVLAANHKLPAIYPQKDFVEDGGLMSYGADRYGHYSRAAIYVDKILKGAKPAEIPVEQPTKFEFFINLKTAKQLAVTIPPNVMARADRVIK
jgi:ABC-type uncharacterized transport system substrate-binding protein